MACSYSLMGARESVYSPQDCSCSLMTFLTCAVPEAIISRDDWAKAGEAALKELCDKPVMGCS